MNSFKTIIFFALIVFASCQDYDGGDTDFDGESGAEGGGFDSDGGFHGGSQFGSSFGSAGGSSFGQGGDESSYGSGSSDADPSPSGPNGGPHPGYQAAASSPLMYRILPLPR